VRRLETDWLELLRATQSAHFVPDSVAMAIQTELRTTMSQRALRSGELDTLAVSLLGLTHGSQEESTK
jgi:hypothetical protein